MELSKLEQASLDWLSERTLVHAPSRQSLISELEQLRERDAEAELPDLLIAKKILSPTQVNQKLMLLEKQLGLS